MQIKTSEYTCNYLFHKGKRVFVFLNGLIGVKDFFSEFKKYKKKDDGYLFIDLPGFGSSNLKKKISKKIINIHVECLHKVLLKENINNFILVLFSLSTIYLAEMKKIKYFSKNIKKIIFVDPSIDFSDLVWSKKINFMNKKFFFNYIKLYKQNIYNIFHSSLVTKKNFDYICDNLKKFDSKVLYKFNKECIKIIKNKKLLTNFKNIKKIFILPMLKKNNKNFNRFKNIFFLEKCGHYIFLDQPKKFFSILKRNA